MNMLTFPYWLIVKFDLHMSSVISENSFHSGSFTFALYPHENIICSKNVPILHTRYVPYGKIGPWKNSFNIYWPSYCKKRNFAFLFCLEAVIFKSLIPLVLSLRYSESLYRCILYICQYLLIELFLYGRRSQKYYPSDSLLSEEDVSIRFNSFSMPRRLNTVFGMQCQKPDYFCQMEVNSVVFSVFQFDSRGVSFFSASLFAYWWHEYYYDNKTNYNYTRLKVSPIRI